MTAPDIDGFDTYGGHKENGAAVEDPTTDRDAYDVNAALCSVAALTHTGMRAWARLVCAASTGALALATVNPCDGMWPNTLANRPTFVRNGVGDYTLTWPATLNDEDGVTHTLAFRTAAVTFEDAWGFTRASCPSANSVRIQLADTTGAASDFVGKTVFIRVW